jgi:hypothetical protein
LFLPDRLSKLHEQHACMVRSRCSRGAGVVCVRGVAWCVHGACGGVVGANVVRAWCVCGVCVWLMDR